MKSIDWSIYPPVNGTVSFFILTTSNFSCIFYVFNFDFLHSLILSYLWWRTCCYPSQVPLLPASCRVVQFWFVYVLLGVFLSKAPSVNPKVYLSPRAGIPTWNQMRGEWRGMSLQPLSKSAEIYSCPSLLYYSKRWTIFLFICGKKNITHCHGGGNLKVIRMGI